MRRHTRRLHSGDLEIWAFIIGHPMARQSRAFDLKRRANLAVGQLYPG